MIKPTIILDRPQMGENIGACARAMMNGGLSDLRIVAPRDGWPNPAAISMAAHAQSIIENARIFDSVADATADLTHLYATTARQRDQVKRILTPRAFGKEAVKQSQEGGSVGVLFGKEATGLENDDIARASSVIRVPLNPENTSLNLGQACLLISYEWFQAQSDIPDIQMDLGRSEFATKGEVDNFLARLVSKLDNNGFLGLPHKRPKMLQNIRNIFERANLTNQEVKTLFGILESLHHMPAPNGHDDSDDNHDADNYAVIFESKQSDTLYGYEEMAKAMITAAESQPGFQRVISARTPEGLGITVSYWDSLKAIRDWGKHEAHKVAQEKGKAQWYLEWVLSTAKIIGSKTGRRK